MKLKANGLFFFIFHDFIQYLHMYVASYIITYKVGRAVV